MTRMKWRTWKKSATYVNNFSTSHFVWICRIITKKDNVCSKSKAYLFKEQRNSTDPQFIHSYGDLQHVPLLYLYLLPGYLGLLFTVKGLLRLVGLLIFTGGKYKSLSYYIYLCHHWYHHLSQRLFSSTMCLIMTVVPVHILNYWENLPDCKSWFSNNN